MSREAKKRILAAGEAFRAQQEQGVNADAHDEVAASRDLWELLVSLKGPPVSFQEGARELLPCKPPTPKEGEKQSKYKWKTSLDEQFVFDFSRATPYESIDKIDWHRDAQGVQRSSAGSEGVFFVGFYGSPCSVVVKGSRNMASEAFASLLAARLALPMPPFRIITSTSKEGSAMLAAFRERDPHGLANANLSSQTHVVVKDFVRGVNLNLMKEDQLAAVMGKPGSPLTESQEARFGELARLLILDVLTNNGDRFPLLWENRGNPGNTMFSRCDGQIIAIDNAIVCLNGEKREEYIAKVRDFKHMLRRCVADGEEAPHTHRVRDKFIEYCNYDFGTEGALVLQKEMLAFTTKHAGQNTLSESEAAPADDASEAKRNPALLCRDELEKWKRVLAEFEPTLVGIHNVDVDFVMSVWETLCEEAEA